MCPHPLLRLILTAALLAVAPVVGVYAQSFLTQDERQLPGSSGPRPVERLSLDEGLSQSTVYAIHQDQQGFMWFGTYGGLNKYDGHSFTVYKPHLDDPHSISSGHVYEILEDMRGDLWLATGDGSLNRFEQSTGRFVRYRHDPDDPHSLSGRGVNFIHEGRDGTIWIGSGGGLSRYDVEADYFTNYVHDPDDPHSLSSPDIDWIYEDASGFLWLADGRSNSFLDRLDPATGRITRLRHNPDDSTSIGGDYFQIWTNNGRRVSFLEDSQGRIWIGMRRSGNIISSDAVLNRYDPKTGAFTRYEHNADDPTSIGVGPLVEIFEDRDGRVWVGKGGSLNRYDAETDHFVHYPDPLPGADWHRALPQVHMDSSGLFWMIAVTSQRSTGEEETVRLERFNPRTGQYIYLAADPSDPSRPTRTIRDIEGEDGAGRIWLAGEGGMDHYDPATGTFTAYTHRPEDPRTLAGVRIFEMFEDRTGVLWFGHYEAGLSKVDPRPAKFLHVTHDPSDPGSLTNPSIWSFLVDEADVLWVGTDAGLERHDAAASRFDLYPYRPVVEARITVDVRINSLLEDEAGVLWVGTDRGLAQFDREARTFTTVPLPRDTEWGSWPPVAPLLEDRLGTLWLGTNVGLYRYDRASEIFKRFHHDPADATSLSHNFIPTLYEDTAGRLWAGTSKGLNRFNRASETFTAFHHDTDDPHSLSSDAITAIAQLTKDSNHLWVGTQHGFNRFNTETGAARRYAEENSDLPNNTVYSIVPDEEDYLWISTNRGLSRFDPRTETFKNYDTNDGLQSKEFNAFAGYRSPSGALYFGGINGFNVVFPGGLEDDSTPPPVALTQLRIYDAGDDVSTIYPELRQQESGKLRLPHDHNDLTFSFAALHFAEPERNRYRYRLEPYEATWSAPTLDRQVRYANLGRGTYTFRVQAANPDGVWNEAGLAFRVEVRPPWWRSLWAYIAYGLLFFAGVFAVDRVQRRRVVAREREKARERELEQAREIKRAYQELRETKDRLVQQEKMASLGALTAGIAHEIKNPLNFVTNFAGVSEELLDELAETIESGELDEAKVMLDDLQLNASKIREHGARADGIVRAMMEHARGESGERELVDLNALVEEYVELAWHGKRARVADFDVKINKMLDPDVGQVEVVPQEIGRVVLNLVDNAFDAVRAQSAALDGQYRPSVAVSTRRKDGHVEIVVADNGPGIADDVRAKLFEPFFTTKPAGSGTGLGLSLSYDIVTQGHAGSMTVDSEADEGSTFIVALPVSGQS